MKRKQVEIRLYLHADKHADILAWAGQQASVSESVIALIRTHLTLSQDPTLREIAAGIQRIEQQLRQGRRDPSIPKEQKDFPPELLDALDALGE